MEYIPFSFIFGMLTVLSPCVLPLLPTILGGTLGHNNKFRSVIIISSLALSIIIFSVLLKSSLEIANNFVDIPDEFWFYLSGGVIVIFGIFTLFPQIWTNIAFKLGFSTSSDKLLEKAASNNTWVSPFLLGFSLGPVFTSCSPTYALITKTLILDSFFIAFINIIVYTIGLCLILLVISIYGQIAIKKLKWASNPNGLFKKILGVMMIVLGILIATGVIKDIETYLLNETGLNITRLEVDILEDRFINN